MNGTCSLHCGVFNGVGKDRFEESADELNRLFDYVRYVEETRTLELTGAKNIEDSPPVLTEIFDFLSRLLEDDDGRGRIMLQCEAHEICYFRRHMWKLMGIAVPDDPFNDIHYVN
jgi:hypothetical protein